ncbi:MAG: serine hydrolase, partial [Cytophagales bacterium]|nr:serine hydrolase [Cytophagales bacterium]
TDRAGIAYVNIGIPHSPVGTLSNADGTFTLTIPAKYQADTLVFSALGYGKRTVPVVTLNRSAGLTLALAPRTTALEAVTVTARPGKRQEFELGNRYWKGGNIYGDSVAAGGAMALLIENKYPSFHPDLQFPAYVQEARLRISLNTLPEFKVRARLMSVDTLTGLPGKDLFEKSIVATSAIKKGWLHFDLSSLNLRLDGPACFLVFEWILEDKDRRSLVRQYETYIKENPDKVTMDTMQVRGEKIAYRNYHNFSAGTSFGVSHLPFSLDNYKSYYRDHSFGEWQRAAFILTARLTVSNQPGGQVPPGAVRGENTACNGEDAPCQATRLVRDFMDEYQVDGAQLAVSRNGKLVLSEGLGLADVEKNRPVTPNTQFKVGSISKALTSAALLQLVRARKLDLDAPVQKYVPGFPVKKHPVTTRQLAGHLAGIRHYHTGSPEAHRADLVRTKHYASATEALEIFGQDTLLYQPGTRYHYSSYGWSLVGAVIEGASGQKYLDYMQANIWQPLGLKRTYGARADSLLPDQSASYEATGGKAATGDPSYNYPGAGLLSTAEDLVAYGNALLQGGYFDGSLARELLFTSQQTADGKPTGYGLGWNILQDKAGRTVWFHRGLLLDGSGFLVLYPEEKLVLAFLANSPEGAHLDAEQLGNLFTARR